MSILQADQCGGRLKSAHHVVVVRSNFTLQFVQTERAIGKVLHGPHVYAAELRDVALLEHVHMRLIAQDDLLATFVTVSCKSTLQECDC